MKRIYIEEYDDCGDMICFTVGVCSDENLDKILTEINSTLLDYDSEKESYCFTLRGKQYFLRAYRKGELAHCEIMQDVFSQSETSLEVEDLELLD